MKYEENEQKDDPFYDNEIAEQYAEDIEPEYQTYPDYGSGWGHSDDGDKENEYDEEHDDGFNEFGKFGEDNEFYPFGDDGEEEDKENEYDEEYDGYDEPKDDGSIREQISTIGARQAISVGGHVKPEYAGKVDQFIQEQIKAHDEEDLLGDKPVDLEELKRWWHIMKRHPISILLRIKKKLNMKVKIAVSTVFTPFVTKAILVMGMRPFDMIGACLNLLDGPIGAIGIGIDIRAVLNFILRLPVIKQVLKFLRKHILPLIRKSAVLIQENKYLYKFLVRQLERKCPQLFN